MTPNGKPLRYFGPMATRYIAIAKLEDGLIRQLLAWCQVELPGMEDGNGPITWGQYREEGLTWGEAARISVRSSRYVNGFILDIKQAIEECQMELEARRRAQEAQTRLAQLAPDEPIFTALEQEAIAKYNLLDIIEQCYTRGRREESKKYHRDHGGSDEQMIPINLSADIMARIMAYLRKEFEGK